MNITLLPSDPWGGAHEFLTSFLVNGTIAIDAGCLGFYKQPRHQAAVTSVFITHSHADHVCSLPMFAMNVSDCAGHGVVVHSHEPVLQSLKSDVFNGRVWPDFTELRLRDRPLVETRTVMPREAIVVDGVTLTAIPVNHPVPTVAYVVDDGRAAVVVCPDSGPTHEIWDVAGGLPNLRAVFLGVAFPDEQAELARAAGHLTPALWRAEVGKLPPDVRAFAMHIKAAHRERVIAQVRALSLPNAEVSLTGYVYDF